MIIHGKCSVHPLFHPPESLSSSSPVFPPSSSTPLSLYLFAPLSTQSFLQVRHRHSSSLAYSSKNSSALSKAPTSPCQSSYQDNYFASFSIFLVFSIFIPPCTSNPSFQTTNFPLNLLRLQLFLSPLTCSPLLFCS